MRYLSEISPQAVEIEKITDDIPNKYDVVIVDYSIRQIRERMDSLLSLGVKIVAIGYISYKEEIDKLSSDTVSVVYCPLNYTKITRALESLFHRDARKNEQPKTEQTDIDISGLKILVAEDNEINQNLIRAVLSNFNLEITLANNGQEALDLRRNNEYDLILMDIQMPVMGGIEATEAILEFEHTEGLEHIPIIALTANALQGDREKYLRAGMDDYVSKPIKIEQIRHVIHEHCTLQPNEQQAPEIEAIAGVSDHPLPTDSEDVPTDALPSNSEDVLTETSSPSPDNESIDANMMTTEEGQEDPARTKAQVDVHETEPIETKPQSDILLFCRSGLVQSLHKHALEKEGFAVEIAAAEETFFAMFEATAYRYVLLDAKLIPEDNCVIAELIRESGAVPFVYAMENSHPCARQTDGYSMIEELREKLVS
jgi:CheY-like chemotaxis protein